MNHFDIIFFLNFDFEVILHSCRRLKDRRKHALAESVKKASPPNGPAKGIEKMKALRPVS